MIQYLRHAFFAARRVSSIDDLNTQLAEWIADPPHQRPVPGDPTGRRVAEALDEERPGLQPRPGHLFTCDHVRFGVSGKKPFRFSHNDYSMSPDLIRRSLTLRDVRTRGPHPGVPGRPGRTGHQAPQTGRRGRLELPGFPGASSNLFASSYN
jgi:hypothetical protein